MVFEISFSSTNNGEVNFSNDHIKSRIISQLRQSESLLDASKFTALKEILFPYLKHGNSVTVTIDNNDFDIKKSIPLSFNDSKLENIEKSTLEKDNVSSYLNSLNDNDLSSESSLSSKSSNIFNQNGGYYDNFSETSLLESDQEYDGELSETSLESSEEENNNGKLSETSFLESSEEENDNSELSETSLESSEEENDNDELSKTSLESSEEENDNGKLSETSFLESEGDDEDNSSSELDDEDNNSLKNGGYYNKNFEITSIFDDETNNEDDEESLYNNARNLKNSKYLNSLNVNNLKEILRSNNLSLSKKGKQLKKNEMIKIIKKI